ncbi:MAG: glycosyltransferase, partial [Proteobacteria bacterium]|nr:glycosyltransferase [Pseudomonadota bacterium]
MSVVIPVLNEAALLPSMLEHWRTLIQDGAEVLFVDGGSTDSTLLVLEEAGFQVIEAARGRARQMNAGATATLGDVLVFLHADTIPPPGMLSILSQALKVSNRVWGRFDVQIAGDS